MQSRPSRPEGVRGTVKGTLRFRKVRPDRTLCGQLDDNLRETMAMDDQLIRVSLLAIIDNPKPLKLPLSDDRLTSQRAIAESSGCRVSP